MNVQQHRESLRREDSPNKKSNWRPSTSYQSPNKRKSQLNYTVDEANAIGASVFTYPGVNIIRELNGKEIKSQDKDIEIERLQTTCFNLNNKAIVAEDLQRDIQIMQTRLAESEAARRDLEKQNEMQEKQFYDKIQAQEKQFNDKTQAQERLFNEKTKAQEKQFYEKTQTQEKQYNDKTQAQEKLFYEKTQAQEQQFNEKTQMHEIQNRNLQDENANLRQDLQLTIQEKSMVQQKLEEAADFNITMEEKVYKSNKISLDLINQLKIAEMQLGYIYVPVKTDSIDVKLAEYINWSTARPALKSLFTRESEGVYQFGSKRVNIKIDSSKILVRVGGGYLKIDEFVDQYLPIEMEKIGTKIDNGYYSTVSDALLNTRKSVSPTKVIRESSPGARHSSPNTRMSTQMRQSVSIKYL